MPRARRSEVAGAYGDAIRIRIAAPPADGAGNAELIRFLAATLAIPRARITIVAGWTARRKMIQVAGLDETTIRQRLLSARG